MPLIRKPGPTAPATPAADPADLASPDPERRRAAAQALAGAPEGVAALAAALPGEDETSVRLAILDGLIAADDPVAGAAVARLLRSEDPGRRMAAVEALQAMPRATPPLMAQLVVDGDADVRVMAAEVARGLPTEEANALLFRMLAEERHPNVVGAALDVLAEVGTPAALPLLDALGARFAADPYLPFAIDATRSRIGGD